ncbi:MAG: cysteine--tRNA ligase [Zetaproteobacteria bacterium]|nr:cysteine--tRNA ligase [Zetaproteobacteria bacterium]
MNKTYPFRLYNSLSRQKDIFRPKVSDKVSVYSCGVTVYDYCHLGHGLQAYTIGILVGYLKRLGYEVKHIRNYTDVDDKIIARAQQRDIKPLELSERMIECARRDFLSLGVLENFTEVKVSENLKAIISMIEDLISAGHAYATDDGHVYFDVLSKHDYGKLSGQKVDCHHASAREIKSGHKRNEQDFVLWKPEKIEGAYWASPWGDGRPGWHIECSALAKMYLGDSIDIHCGGLDLIFPHHENEIAQSECANGCEFARFWVHNGLLTIDKQKMSKSLGNFITIEDCVRRFHPEVIKLAFCQNHYRSNLDLSEQIFIQTLKKLLYFYQTLQTCEGLMQRLDMPYICQKFKLAITLHDAKCIPQEVLPHLHPHGAEFVKLLEEVTEAMADDLNTPKAFAAIHQVFKLLNQVMAGKKSKEIAALCSWVRQHLDDWFALFGILQQSPEKMLHLLSLQGIEALGVKQAEVEALLAARATARENKNWMESDRIRDQLEQLGVAVLDRAGETFWTLA